MQEDTTTSGGGTIPADSQAQVIDSSNDEVTGNSEAAQLESESTEKNTEAVDTSEETSQTNDSEESGPPNGDNSEEAVASEEAEIKEWAAKKNLPLDDPLKIAKMYRESEKQLGKKGQQEGQLKNAVSDANNSAGADDIQALRNEVAALNFYIGNPDAKKYEDSMVEILDEKPWLASDLDAVLDIAKGRAATDSERLLAERQAGKKEALETVAQKQRAAPPQASATTRETPPELNLDEVEARLSDGRWSTADYTQWRKENNPFAS